MQQVYPAEADKKDENGRNRSHPLLFGTLAWELSVTFILLEGQQSCVGYVYTPKEALDLWAAVFPPNRLRHGPRFFRCHEEAWLQLSLIHI